MSPPAALTQLPRQGPIFISSIRWLTRQAPLALSVCSITKRRLLPEIQAAPVTRCARCPFCVRLDPCSSSLSRHQAGADQGRGLSHWGFGGGCKRSYLHRGEGRLAPLCSGDSEGGKEQMCARGEKGGTMRKQGGEATDLGRQTEARREATEREGGREPPPSPRASGPRLLLVRLLDRLVPPRLPRLGRRRPAPTRSASPASLAAPPPPDDPLSLAPAPGQARAAERPAVVPLPALGHSGGLDLGRVRVRLAPVEGRERVGAPQRGALVRVGGGGAEVRGRPAEGGAGLVAEELVCGARGRAQGERTGF